MNQLDAPVRSQRVVTVSATSARAVPVVVGALQALLQTHVHSNVERGSAEALLAVEQELTSGGSLQLIDGDVIKSAVVELDVLGCLNPGLGILRLQMIRQVAANEARRQADQTARTVNWMPEPRPKSAKDKTRSTLQFESGFPDTVSTKPGAAEELDR